MPYINDCFYRIYDGNSHDTDIPVILLHGSGGSHMAWPSDMRRLPGRRVIAIDLPGHGKSEIAVCHSLRALVGRLKGFLQDMHISQAVLVGHSLGAALALKFTALYPERVKGLMLFSAGNKFLISDDLLDLLRNPGNQDRFIEAFGQLAFEERFPQSLRREILKPLVKIRTSTLLADFLICSRFRAMSDLYYRVGCPVRLVNAANDPICLPASALQLAHLLPYAELTFLPNCGHLLLYEKTTLVSHILCDFLEKVNS